MFKKSTERMGKVFKIKAKSHLWWLHVQNFCDTPLHDEEVWVVDIELYRPEQILHPHVVCVAAIDEVLVTTTNDNLRKRSTVNEADTNTFNFYYTIEYIAWSGMSKETHIDNFPAL